MSTKTKNFGWDKPAMSDTPGVTIPQIANNLEAIDAALTNVNSSLADMTNLRPVPRPVIWLTDFAGDCDDAAAGRVLLWAERQGMIDLVAVCANTTVYTIVSALDAFLTAEGRPGVTIGWDSNGVNYSSKYHNVLMSYWRYSYSPGGKTAESDVSVLRRALATATHPVDIISTGFMNNLYNLLQSGADSISPLTGLQLVQQKAGTLWQMGGQYPSGTEYNFSSDATSKMATQYVVTNWPNPIIFCGAEVGNAITSGDTMSSYYPAGNVDPLQAIYNAFGANSGRQSWDPITAYIACLGDPNLSMFQIVQGTNTVDSYGANKFIPNNKGPHKYIVKTQNGSLYQRYLNNIYEKRSWSGRKVGAQQLPKLSLTSGAIDSSHLVGWWNADDLSGTPTGTQINFFEDRTRINHLRAAWNELPTYTTVSGKSALQFGPPTGTNAWVASNPYSLNANVIPSTPNGFYYTCTTAGTSGTTPPTWPTTPGNTVTDGSVVWKCCTTRLSSDNVDCPSNMTVYAKVLWSSLPTAIQTILAQDYNDGTNRNWQMNGNVSGQAQSTVFSGSTPTSDNNTTAISSNAWVVLTSVITPTTIKTYVNGVGDAGTPITSPNTSTMFISMGALGYNTGAGSLAQALTGYIHEARIYSAVHDATAIQNVINQMT